MAKPIISIIGMGTIGTSIGLGLQREDGNFEIVGHDKEPEASMAARKAGAIQRSDWNLHGACEGADLVVVTIPLGELDGLFDLIAEDLKPGCLVLTLGHVMQLALEIGRSKVPDNVHYVVGHPILSGVGSTLSARADLFDEVTFCLATSVDTNPDALQLASDFVERIGATAFFIDATEHDGIIAGVEQLPQLLAATLLDVSRLTPSWAEGKRLAGRRFAQSTELGASAQQLSAAWRSNRASLLQRIDQLRTELDTWRELVAAEPISDEEDALLAALTGVEKARNRWIAQADLKNWDEVAEPDDDESSPGMFRQLFFGNLGRRRGRADSGQP